MRLRLADRGAFVRVAAEALGRYKLRTALSVLGVVLGVAAVIAMMSVSEGAEREALAQVDALGLDNLVVRAAPGSEGRGGRALAAGDADRLEALVPLVRASSPLSARYLPARAGHRTVDARVLGVRPAFQSMLGVTIDRGRALTAADEREGARVCVLGAGVAGALFGYRDAIGESIDVGGRPCRVVGVLAPRGADRAAPGSVAWHDLDQAVVTPLAALSGVSLAIAPDQPADEVWLQLGDGSRAGHLAPLLQHTVAGLLGHREFSLVVPRELLAQRMRLQRTFRVVVGSVAALALLVGGIGIMNIMLTSVVERTREIGVRRTMGATRRDITLQFLVETLLMTIGGGALGIGLGIAASWAIAGLAGWATHVSAVAVALAFAVSFLVGLLFGWYPAVKAAALEPVDAMRHE